MPEVTWYNVPLLLGFSIAQIWTFVTPLIAGAVGAWLTRWFRRRDDKELRRTELIATKMQEAYLLVGEALEYPGMDPQQALSRKLKLESALAIVDLYADPTTRRSAREIIEQYERGAAWIEYVPLLTALRDRFRDSIGLERLDDPVRLIKFIAATSPTSDSPTSDRTASGG